MSTDKSMQILKAGDVHYTDSSHVCYLLENGRAMVSLIPTKENIKKRALFLCEIGESHLCPGVFYEDGESVWRLSIIALTDVSFTVLDDVGKVAQSIEEFVELAHIKDVSLIGFEEALAEKYRLSMVKDSAYFYQTTKDRKGVQDRGHRLISNVFTSHNQKTPVDEPSKNNLYNAIRFACRKERIQVADYSTIVGNLGSAFSIEDVARLSDFLVRRITLDDEWFRKDAGLFIAFKASNLAAVICQPHGPRCYSITDLESNTSEQVTREIAEGLLDYGYVLSCPFPAKPLFFRDIVQFILNGFRWKDAVSYFAMAFMGTLIGIVIPEVTRAIYDVHIPAANLSAAIQFGSFAICLILSNLCFKIVKEYALIRIFQPVKHRLEGAVYHRLFNLPVSFFRTYDSGDLANRAIGISAIWGVFSQMIFINIVTFFMAFVFIFRMVGYSLPLTLAAISMLFIIVFLRSLLVRKQTALEKERTALNGKTTSIFYQYLEGLEKIRLSGAEDSAFYRYLRPYTRMKMLQHHTDKVARYMSLLSMASSTLFTVAFFAIIARQSLDISPGVYVAFSGAFGGFSGAVMSITEAVHSLVKIKPELDRAQPLMEMLPESEGKQGSAAALDGEIELSNVSFSYDNAKTRSIDKVSLHIKPGEYLGVVGFSGSGKSTLMKLLLGFEMPFEGQVFFSGRDINTLNKRELRKSFGIVLQHGKLLQGSILENMTITAPGKTIEEVQRVVEAVGLQKDIDQMPMGLHTMVSEDAGTISGGQKQRILIARALMNQPKVLLFDEATSALDNITQQLVADTMESLAVTRITIAHRLSTVRHCDRIIVMQRGRICEEGSYEELMEKRSVFYQLASRQII